MPLQQETFRQFFRIVTSKVSLWYKDHSTANPLGVEPDPEITKVVVGDKFSEEGVEVVEDPGARERRRQELERIRAEEGLRCEWHQHYAGVCNCNNKEDDQEDLEEQDEDEERDVVEVDNEKVIDEEKLENTSSNVTQTEGESNTETEHTKDSQVCSVL